MKSLKTLAFVLIGGMFSGISVASPSERDGDKYLAIDGVPLRSDIAALVRHICFDGRAFILASNANGSDLIVERDSQCMESGVISYDFIFGEQLGRDQTGFLRKLSVGGIEFYMYTSKSGAPVITSVD